MKFFVKSEWHAESKCGKYAICWTGADKPMLTVSYREKILGYTQDKDRAKQICEEHRDEITRRTN
ncbi:hypothetical protein [Aliikangiella coralliicola]|uniref:Uncharacterized protein n=1 Tax=Aliikangiella coralliicola TaxID=2592383 RepID=A0A545U045_9GAMM|nr:hypothetical protein [Aliikangiella coralliicola]TQV82836.1 hypothetical protein FLL46_24005 [Aliikangiella coralliicola]